MRTILLLLIIVLSSPVWADSLSDARGAMAAYREEMKAVGEARVKGDEQAFNEHQGKAQRFLKDARDAFDAAHAQDSDDASILKDYADVLLQLGDSDLAADVYRRLTKITPDDPTAWFLLGRSLSLIGPGGAGESVKALNQALALTPNDSPDAIGTLLLLGKVYRTSGLFEFARECAEKALSLDPNNLGAQLALVAANVLEGNIAAAAADLDAIGLLPPEYAAGIPSLLGEALDSYQESRHLLADTPENHMAYAKLLLYAGRIQSSLLAAERAAMLDPGSTATWNLIGALSSQLGDTAKARRAYERSLQLDPNDIRTREALEALK